MLDLPDLQQQFEKHSYVVVEKFLSNIELEALRQVLNLYNSVSSVWYILTGSLCALRNVTQL